MANKKQSEFPVASGLTGEEIFGVIQGGVNRKTILSTIKSYILQSVNANTLTGLSTVTNAVVTAADSILQGIGKLQAQLNYFSSMFGNCTPVLVLAKSSVAVTCPNTTDEENLATIVIPANIIGTTGMIRVTSLWSYTNSANTKTLRQRFGGIAGVAYLSVAPTTTATYQSQITIRNRNSASSQVGHASAAATAFSISTAAATTSTVDTTSATTLVITAQKALSTESIVLESYLVEIIK